MEFSVVCAQLETLALLKQEVMTGSHILLHHLNELPRQSGGKSAPAAVWPLHAEMRQQHTGRLSTGVD